MHNNAYKEGLEINYIMMGIGISYGVNFILLYTRKQKWNSDQLRWVITGMFLAIGTMGLCGVFN